MKRPPEFVACPGCPPEALCPYCEARYRHYLTVLAERYPKAV